MAFTQRIGGESGRHLAIPEQKWAKVGSSQQIGWITGMLLQQSKAERYLCWSSRRIMPTYLFQSCEIV